MRTICLFSVLTALWLPLASVARDNGQWAQVAPELRRWFSQLHNKMGYRCCDDADGFDAQWDTKDNHYRVYDNGRWYVVPDEKVVTEPNKLGVAKVWWSNALMLNKEIRCFMPGTEG
jgi:hypothetical protein